MEIRAEPDGRTGTARLDLDEPRIEDVPQLFRISSDPRLWTHFPSGRPTEEGEVAAGVRRWLAEWQEVGLGIWTVRLAGSPEVIGYGGCSLRRDAFWNLAYRLAPSAHGAGYATELALEGIRRARLLRPDEPVIARLLEHNLASAAVARRVGLDLRHRGPDQGNPDPAAIRLVFSDRPLTPDQLAAALR
jgi:RimJ/RimL family protein N-acetyltransferase